MQPGLCHDCMLQEVMHHTETPNAKSMWILCIPCIPCGCGELLLAEMLLNRYNEIDVTEQLLCENTRFQMGVVIK